MQHTHVPKSVLIIFLCLFVVILSSCSKDDVTITTPIENLPTCFDPQIASGEDIESIINNCFEGLVRIDKNGNIQNGVASSWTISSDGLTYTFELRSDAKWYVPSDAEEILGDDYKKTFDDSVTANDFVFAIRRGMDANTNAPAATTLSIVSDVYAESDTKLVIKLSTKSDGFLTILSTPICMPCNEEFFEATNGRYGLSTGLILSNGPYYLSSFDEDNGVIIKLNESYSGEYKAISDKVKFVLVTDGSVGSCDVEKLSLDEVQNLGTEYTTKKYKNAIKAFCFNAKEPQFSDLSIRLALAMSTNKEYFLSTDAIAAEGVVPSCCWLYAGSSYRANSNKVDFVEFDIDSASTMFSEIKQDISLNIVCLASDEENVKKVIQDWQKTFGVSLTIVITTVEKQDELDNVVESGNYQIAYTTLVTNDFLASDFLSEFKTNAEKNILCLASDDYDTLLSDSYSKTSAYEYAQSLKACESYLVENAYIVPIVVADTYIATTDVAKDVTVQPSGTIYAFYS